MRRDLDLDFDPSQIVLEPPDRSQLREMFRRYEFRGLLNRIDDLEDAIPAAVPVPVAGTVVPWREGELPQVHGRAGLADRRRPLRARAGGRRRRRPLGRDLAFPAARRRPRRARLQVAAAADDASRRRHADRGLPDRARPLRVRDRRPPARVRARGDPGAGDRGGDGRADHARRGRAAAGRADARARRRARLRAPLRRDRAAAHRRARLDGGRRRQDRHLPDGRDHGPPRRPASRSWRRRRTTSRARSSCSARRSRSHGSSSRCSA